MPLLLPPFPSFPPKHPTHPVLDSRTRTELRSDKYISQKQVGKKKSKGSRLYMQLILLCQRDTEWHFHICLSCFPRTVNYLSIKGKCSKQQDSPHAPVRCLLVNIYLKKKSLFGFTLVVQTVMNLPAVRRPRLIPGLGRSSGEGNGNPLQ